MNLTSNNKTITKIHIVLAAAYTLLAVCVFGYMSTGNRHGPRNPEEYRLLGLLFGFPIALHLIARIGAAGGKLWGRRLSRAIGILMLFGFPVGTVIGASLLYLTKPSKWHGVDA